MINQISSLQANPKSRIFESGYINVYSDLSAPERKQLFYNREYKKINLAWDNTMVALCGKFRQAITMLPKNNGTDKLTVLDAGCGNGNYVIDEFRKEITWASGVDLDNSATGKNICLDEIKHADLNALPYPDKTFDVVLSLWVFEHIKQPETVLKEINRVLKPGGFFIFATPNKNCLLLKLRRILRNRRIVTFINKKLYGREDEDIFPTFYRANDLKSLSSFLKANNFVDINLQLNYDPGYTSFGAASFKISNVLDKIFNNIKPDLFKQHIIGVAKKCEAREIN